MKSVFKESFKNSTMRIVDKNSLYGWQNVFIKGIYTDTELQTKQPKLSCVNQNSVSVRVWDASCWCNKKLSKVLCKYSDTIQQVQMEMQTVEQLSTSN